MPLTESQKKAKKKYDKKTYKLILVFYPTEEDILTHMRTRQLPMSTYIKDLIRKDMEKERNESVNGFINRAIKSTKAADNDTDTRSSDE